MRGRGEKERVSESCAFSADFEWRRRGRRRRRRRRLKKEAEAAKEGGREGAAAAAERKSSAALSLTVTAVGLRKGGEGRHSNATRPYIHKQKFTSPLMSVRVTQLLSK